MTHKTDRKNEIIIRISGLSNGLQDYHFSVEPSLLTLNDYFRNNIEIGVQLEKTSRQIYLKASIQTAGNFQCDRCLDEFQQPISASYGICYVYTTQDLEKFPPEELQIINPDTVSLNITEDIRQMILLSIPPKLLCREDCMGLCPHCGTNWNQQKCGCKIETKDPRWQSLQDLLHH